MADLLVIANGRFQRGPAGRGWEAVMLRLRQLFGEGVEIKFTARREHATELAREALASGTGWIAAAGGDGTINEVVNGYFEKGQNLRPGVPLSFLPCGSGNDWARTLGLPPDILMAVEGLARASLHTVDVGHARFRNFDGSVGERVFLNVAEAGAGGRLVAKRSTGGGYVRRRLGYRLDSLATALAHPAQNFRLIIDGSTETDSGPILSLIVAGGRYFGGGMHCAPMARPDDGYFEVITLGDFGWAEILTKIATFFSGTYIRDRKVTHRSVSSLEASSDGEVYLEMDGELAGTLPAAFTVLPLALQLRY